MNRVKLLISDFDGTLVDTFEPNYLGYRDAFEAMGMSIDRDTYRSCFGLRFDRFMERMGINDDAVRRQIRDLKTEFYPRYFDRFRVNRVLLNLLDAHHRGGGLTAIASTARVENLMNALDHIGARSTFDIIIAGEQVKDGKPSPEIYLTVLEQAGVTAAEALIFEDSPVGIQAAEAAGIAHIVVTPSYFE
ncbi:MAG: HAD family phosphatase [Muribaculaceae bacterium]|nr:HAD family phosphatase [Muribaculaceae bacterium]